MAKRKKSRPSNDAPSSKRQKIEVIFEDKNPGENKNPFCPQGPTLLFKRTEEETNEEKLFYACSIYRNSKDCSFKVFMDNGTGEFVYS